MSHKQFAILKLFCSFLQKNKKEREFCFLDESIAQYLISGFILMHVFIL